MRHLVDYYGVNIRFARVGESPARLNSAKAAFGWFVWTTGFLW